MTYSCYLLIDASRERIINSLGARYSKIICHHITYEFGSDKLPPEVKEVKIVGLANKLPGIEALVVEIDGKIHRPDGKIYHITLSLDPEKRKPVDSNLAISKGWLKYDTPWFPKIEVTPSVQD